MTQKWTRVFIGAGSNLGNRAQFLREAQTEFENTPGIRLRQASTVEETAPVGGPPQDHFLNAVWAAETELAPEALLQRLLTIEQKFGRVRREKNGPRTLDLDILFYGDAVIEKPGLTIPHPRAHERAFVLRPMAELAPQWQHPRLQQTMQALWEACLDRSSRS